MFFVSLNLASALLERTIHYCGISHVGLNDLKQIISSSGIEQAIKYVFDAVRNGLPSAQCPSDTTMQEISALFSDRITKLEKKKLTANQIDSYLFEGTSESLFNIDFLVLKNCKEIEEEVASVLFTLCHEIFIALVEEIEF